MGINILNVNNRQDFRKWLKNNHDKEQECYLVLKRGKPIDNEIFYYIDAVEEALCFGWIDSTLKNIDGKLYQRFSKRRKNGPFSELNRARVKRLEKLGLMDDSGRKVLPKTEYKMDQEIEKALKEARVYSKFKRFPKLYQRIKIYNVSFARNHNIEAYQKALAHLIKMTKDNKMYGEWNDYGRLEE